MHVLARSVLFSLPLGLCLPGVANAVDDHLKCYKVRDPLILKGANPSWLDLDGPDFGLEQCRVVGGFRLFCTPVAKTITQQPSGKLKGEVGTPQPLTPLPFEGAPEQIRHCYKIKCTDREPSPPNPELEITDQFGTRTLTKLKPFLMCGPASGPCADDTFEPNESVGAASFLGVVTDDDSDGGSLAATAGLVDEDWYSFSVTDQPFLTLDPTAAVTPGNGLRVCTYYECSAGVTQLLPCAAGDTADFAPNGAPGCCSDTGSVTINPSCNGAIDDDGDAFVRIQQPGPVECRPYTLDWNG